MLVVEQDNLFQALVINAPEIFISFINNTNILLWNTL